MKKKTTPEIEKQVQEILSASRFHIRKELIKLIERIEYLEGQEFYEGIKKDILKGIRKQTENTTNDNN